MNIPLYVDIPTIGNNFSMATISDCLFAKNKQEKYFQSVFEKKLKNSLNWSLVKNEYDAEPSVRVCDSPLVAICNSLNVSTFTGYVVDQLIGY